MANVQDTPRTQRASTAPDPLIGRLISERFRIESVIARGGMGKVYRASQEPLGREVALKVLQPAYSGEQDPEFHRRFFLEASICARLTHPNTVTIFDYGRTEDDIYYIAMELLEGRTLQATLREERPFTPQRAVHIAAQVCRSLREAHAMGVIHRDLKPANIFLVRHGDEHDFVKVLDFGLVKDIRGTGEDLTETGLFMGSPKYMSPEQIRSEPVDVRTDVYSLGVILYEMLSGAVPFTGTSSVNILMAHVHDTPPALRDAGPAEAVSPELERVVMRALAKNPAGRFADMDALLEGLLAAVSQEHAGIGVHPVAAAPLAAAPGASPQSPAAVPLALRVPAGAPGREGPAPAEAAKRADGIRGPLIAAALVLVAALAAGGLIAAGSDGEPGAEATPPVQAPSESTSPTPQPLPAPESQAEPPGEEPPAPEPRLLLALRSDPPGAMVLLGERRFGPTPTDVELTGDIATSGGEISLLFQLDRYRDLTVTRRVSGDRMEVNARLQRARGRARPGPGDGVTTRPSIGLKGYKAEPY